MRLGKGSDSLSFGFRCLGLWCSIRLLGRAPRTLAGNSRTSQRAFRLVNVFLRRYIGPEVVALCLLVGLLPFPLAALEQDIAWCIRSLVARLQRWGSGWLCAVWGFIGFVELILIGPSLRARIEVDVLRLFGVPSRGLVDSSWRNVLPLRVELRRLKVSLRGSTGNSVLICVRACFESLMKIKAVAPTVGNDFLRVLRCEAAASSPCLLEDSMPDVVECLTRKSQTKNEWPNGVNQAIGKVPKEATGRSRMAQPRL